MIKIGLIGLGNVGDAVYSILQKNAALIADRIGQDVAIKSVAVRNVDKYRDKIDSSIKLTNDVMSVIEDPEIGIIVEVMGGEHPALEYITAALKNKKSVVTANKEVIAKHKRTFFELAKENGVDIFFEAAVGGGIPIIRSLKVGFAANKNQFAKWYIKWNDQLHFDKNRRRKTRFFSYFKKSTRLRFR